MQRQWCDLDLTFDLGIVTLISYLGYISETIRSRKFIRGREIG